jgi:hypothetical protein
MIPNRQFLFKRKMTWLLCVQRKLSKKSSINIMPLSQHTRKKRVMSQWNRMRMILILTNNVRDFDIGIEIDHRGRLSKHAV